MFLETHSKMSLKAKHNRYNTPNNNSEIKANEKKAQKHKLFKHNC